MSGDAPSSSPPVAGAGAGSAFPAGVGTGFGFGFSLDQMSMAALLHGVNLMPCKMVWLVPRKVFNCTRISICGAGVGGTWRFADGERQDVCSMRACGTHGI
jgi:hypothetical protein